MEMDYQIDRLKANARAIVDLIGPVSQEQAVWRPGESRWSVLEVMGHLYDIEREDFRVDLDIVLHHPEQAWPSFDIHKWAIDRRYNEGRIDESLDAFLREREKSVDWLGTLTSPSWQKKYSGPGSDRFHMRAGDIVASWIAHDLLHMTQITKLLSEYLSISHEPFSTQYAGSLD